MHARALEPGADRHFTASLHHAGRGAEALFVELWISHAVPIVPAVADTTPGLLVIAGVHVEPLFQRTRCQAQGPGTAPPFRPLRNLSRRSDGFPKSVSISRMISF